MTRSINNKFPCQFYFVLFVGIMLLLVQAGRLHADDVHYKNVLVGDRAATMGGSYVAIADDASGGYYNPAGLVYAPGNNVSGSAISRHSSETVYQNTIENHDWIRKSDSSLPNFFGFVKKFGHVAMAFSYVVPDILIEHQDQTFTQLNNLASPIDRYVLNVNLQDITTQTGFSWAYQAQPSFSVGLSLFRHERDLRLQQDEFLAFSNGDVYWSHQNVEFKERGYVPKLGIQFSPVEPLTFGLTFSKTLITSSRYKPAVSEAVLEPARDLSQVTYTPIPSDFDKRKTPLQTSLGIAWYPSPFMLFTMDIDYFTATDADLNAVWNLSMGTEYFLNEGHALRAGYFTNRTNQLAPDANTTSPHEYLNMEGLSFGYASYTHASSFTIGLVYSLGRGTAHVFQGSNESRDLTRETLTIMLAASTF
ncbi:MAG: aromatic hydrocarbon degradation protein [SAR324 cluster bacterium]|nr:aromatic hydrocarbon degradation protein [SAR324 cluster bacterium]